MGKKLILYMRREGGENHPDIVHETLESRSILHMTQYRDTMYGIDSLQNSSFWPMVCTMKRKCLLGASPSLPEQTIHLACFLSFKRRCFLYSSLQWSGLLSVRMTSTEFKRQTCSLHITRLIICQKSFLSLYTLSHMNCPSMEV